MSETRAIITLFRPTNALPTAATASAPAGLTPEAKQTAPTPQHRYRHGTLPLCKHTLDRMCFCCCLFSSMRAERRFDSFRAAECVCLLGDTITVLTSSHVAGKSFPCDRSPGLVICVCLCGPCIFSVLIDIHHVRTGQGSDGTAQLTVAVAVAVRGQKATADGCRGGGCV